MLQAKNISKRFKSSSEEISLFEELDLELAAGESISIQGESGCGKTTLLHVLSFLENFDSGSILFKGKSIPKNSSQMQLAFRKNTLGMIFQNHYVFEELDVLENVLMSRRIQGSIGSQERYAALSLLKEVGLEDRAHFLPKLLSGGEKQRVSIARALIKQPAILFADEPTGSLDETNGNKILNLLLDLCAQRSIGLILVTHNKAFAQKTQKQFQLCQKKLLPL